MAGDELSGPPPIAGVRRSFASARGVRFHVTESGEGTPVVLLHGWPQHHYCYRHLLADPPDGLRLIAPDLPGYGWSGPAPHRWAKDDVASDVLALMDVLELERVLLAGHDWGGWVGFQIALRAPERVSGYMPLNMAHPWNTFRTAAPHAWRFLTYQPPVALLGMPLHRHTRFLELVFRLGVTRRAELGPEVVRTYMDRFRDPIRARRRRTPIARSGGTSWPTGQGIPSAGGPRSRSARFSASTTSPSTTPSPRPSRRMPMTTRSNGSRTAGISSPRNAPTSSGPDWSSSPAQSGRSPAQPAHRQVGWSQAMNSLD